MDTDYLLTYETNYDWHSQKPYSVEQFFKIIENFVENNFYGFQHPLGRKLLDGKFTPQELKFLAIQEYYYYWGTTWWNAYKVGNADTLLQQRKLHDALLDELGTDLIEKNGLPAHSALFLKYCEGLGVTLEEIQAHPIATGVMIAITELLRIAKYRPHYEFIACSNLVVEKMRPPFYASLLETFKKYYTWVPKDALLFYEIHAHLDVHHTSIGKKIVTEYIQDSKRDQDAVYSAILRSTALRKVMYDSIYLAMSNPGTEYGVKPWPNFPHEPWPRPSNLA